MSDDEVGSRRGAGAGAGAAFEPFRAYAALGAQVKEPCCLGTVQAVVVPVDHALARIARRHRAWLRVLDLLTHGIIKVVRRSASGLEHGRRARPIIARVVHALTIEYALLLLGLPREVILTEERLHCVSALVLTIELALTDDGAASELVAALNACRGAAARRRREAHRHRHRSAASAEIASTG